MYIITASRASANTDNRLLPLETQRAMDTGGNKPNHMVSWVWLVSLLEGDWWPHSLPWWRQLHGADSVGKWRENKASASCLPASLPDIWGWRWGGGGPAQETPTHCFASFISRCVNSLDRYACATVFVRLHPGWPQCCDVLTDCFKIPSRQFTVWKSSCHSDNISWPAH